jgi:hypothetical protein
MKNSSKKVKKEEEVADKAIGSESAELSEIKKFIRMKQLENKVLKKLSEDMGLTIELGRIENKST